MPVMNDYEATAAIRSLPGAWDKQTGNRGCVSERNCIRFCIKLKLGKRHVKYDDEK